MQRLLNLLDINYFHNYPITSANTKQANNIWGINASYLQGKTTQEHPIHLQGVTNAPLTQTIRNHHIDVTRCTDFFYVQRPFFIHHISESTVFHKWSREKLFKI